MWPFKTTVKFVNDDGNEIRLHYAVSAGDVSEAKSELEKRFLSLEVFGYKIEEIVAATKREAATLNLPAGCVVLLA
jgi:hypothetical protein